MKKLMMTLILALMAAGVTTVSGQTARKTGDVEMAIFKTNIHCESCQTKIEDKLPFEKGVKDVLINLEEKTIRVDFDRTKTDAAKIKKAIEKLGYKADEINPETGLKKAQTNKPHALGIDAVEMAE